MRAVLEAYAVSGVIGLARRDGNRRFYDLLERLLPPELLAQEVPLREQLSHKLLSRLPRPRPPRRGGAGDIFDRHRPAPDPRSPGDPGRNALREELVERGAARPGRGGGPARQTPRPRRRSPAPRGAAGAGTLGRVPCTVRSLVWDTPLLGSLFGFDYVWELFVPPAKRRWGWYVLPIIFRDRLVGRIEPRIDRARGRVEMLDIWWEDSFAPDRAEGFADAMRDALRAYLRFAGAGRVEWASHLGTEKRLFLARP